MVKSAKALVNEWREIYGRADAEGRSLTPDENRHVQALVADAETALSVEKLSKRLGTPSPFAGSESSSAGSGPGDVFVRSEGYKAVRMSDTRPQEWSTGLVEVSHGSPLEYKGTLLETTAGGPGGGLVPPYWEPGIVSRLFEPLGVSALFGTSQTTGSQVRYVTEGTATSGAAGVAEGALKPESTLGYSEVVEPVKKLATFLPISEEMLEDAPQVQSYLNERLGLFIAIEEEEQILRGAGGNDLVGMFSRGISTTTRGTATNAQAILNAAAGVRGSANLTPDGVIMHPSNWLTTRSQVDTAGQYLGGGPFGASYGNAQQVDPFAGAPIWGMRVVLSSVVGPGTALIGAFSSAAHIWRRGGPRIEASSSHADYFQRNLIAIRAEERLALGCYRSTAFVGLSGLQ